jgi:hypothetical protein
VLNTTFKDISVTTFVAEIGVLREKHRPVSRHRITLSHAVLSSTPLHAYGVQTHNIRGDRQRLHRYKYM